MSINDTISSYRRRRNRLLPTLLGGLALVLVIIGIIIVATTLKGGGLTKYLATETPTLTITPSPTNTVTPTETLTITPTPTITLTATPSSIYDYTIQEGDTLTSIVEAKDLGPNGLILLYMLNPTIDPNTGMIAVGDVIKVPPPNYPLPTGTPLPTGIVPGSRITYLIMPGDSLGSIANKLNSTVAAIVAANPTVLKDGDKSIIYPGGQLVVPVNLVTPVPTKAPTATPTATAQP
jgi:LysM repeat protein